jgi:rod shape determining protein RodA
MWRWLADRTDFLTLALLLALSAVSVVAVHSATHSRSPDFWGGAAGKQALFALVGVAAFFLVQSVDYHDWADLAFVLYWIGVGLLLLVLVLARPIAGAKAWFELGPVRFQPSEPVKALCALACAVFLARAPGKLDFVRLVKLGLLVALPMLLVAVEPDMGTAVTYAPLFLGLAWMAGLRPKVLIVLALLAALAAPVGWFTVLKPYQKERIRTVIDPNRDPAGIGYQTIQSRIAVGSGEVVGRGLFQGSQSRLEFLPARETDFILGVIAEETGFVGVFVVLTLFIALLFRALRNATTAQDYLGTLIVVGVVSIWTGQLFINTGMVTGVVPTIGVPLPGLSYGGSSIVATFIAFGLVASVRNRRLVNA